MLNNKNRLIRVQNWSNSNFAFRMVSNISSDSKGRIYIAHRGEHPIVVFSQDGDFLYSVGDSHILKSINVDLTVSPPAPISTEYWLHGLHVDHWDNIWVTDVGRHLVMKFSSEGELLMTLGTPDKSGCDSLTFNQPTSVAVAQNGDIFIADGYGNARVAKFDADGLFLQSWGSKGNKPGEFDTPHAIAIAPNGNVIVAERTNNRIQIFDAIGNLLALCTDLPAADGLSIFPDSSILVGTARGALRLHKISLEGELLDVFGMEEYIGYPHGVHLTKDGILFIADPINDNANRPPSKLLEH